MPGQQRTIDHQGSRNSGDARPHAGPAHTLERELIDDRGAVGYEDCVGACRVERLRYVAFAESGGADELTVQQQLERRTGDTGQQQVNGVATVSVEGVGVGVFADLNRAGDEGAVCDLHRIRVAKRRRLRCLTARGEPASQGEHEAAGRERQ